MFSGKKNAGLRGAICIVAVLGLFASASPALASTARLNKLGVEYTADPGEANNVTITGSRVALGGFNPPVAIDIADAGATITPEWPFLHAWGCDHNSLLPGGVFCALEEPSSLIFLDLDDQDDRFSMVFARAVAVQGGEGDDNLSGGPGTDDLRGESGNDTLDGGAGNDFLAGFAGIDRLIGGTGSDGLVGGPGFDIADYSARTAPVTVTVGDAVGDGEAGEGDNVAIDVEHVRGGSGDDTLVASSAATTLTGGPGFDNLIGGPGNDNIYAADGGFDRIDCGGGYDIVHVDVVIADVWAAGAEPGPVIASAFLAPDQTTNCEWITID
jgi:hypothetical protein